MAKSTYGPGPHKTFRALCTTACAAGDLCMTSSTGFVPATDGLQAEAYCVEGAGAAAYGVFTSDEGLEATFTGTVAAQSLCYVAGAQAVDTGAQGNKHCGISTGLVPWDSTKCIVRLHFKAVETTSHA